MHYRFKTGEETLTYGVDPVKENHLKVSTGEKTLDVRYTVITDHHVHCVVDGVGVNAFVTGEKGEKTILIRGVPYVVCDADSTARDQKRCARSDKTSPGDYAAHAVGRCAHHGCRGRQCTERGQRHCPDGDEDGNNLDRAFPGPGDRNQRVRR